MRNHLVSCSGSQVSESIPGAREHSWLGELGHKQTTIHIFTMKEIHILSFNLHNMHRFGIWNASMGKRCKSSQKDPLCLTGNHILVKNVINFFVFLCSVDEVIGSHNFLCPKEAYEQGFGLFSYSFYILCCVCTRCGGFRLIVISHIRKMSCCPCEDMVHDDVQEAPRERDQVESC